MRVALVLACLGSIVYADTGSPDDTALQTHIFVSQGALLSGENNYLVKSTSGSLEFTEAGINFTKSLDDRLTAGVQLFARDLGPQGNYSAKFDWLYLDYRWKDWLGFRAGRVKLPFGLYNDTSDIDAAQPVVLLPQSIYPEVDREFLLAQTGVELYGYVPIGDAGAIAYNAYLGTLYLSVSDIGATNLGPIEVPYITGGRLMWETPVDGLRVGASVLAGELDADYSANGVTAPISYKVLQGLGSIEYQRDGVLLAAEYGRTRGRTGLPTGTTSQTSEQMYGLAGYRWRSWLQTTVYYSLLYPDVDQRSGREHHQHDAALALRFDITPHWLCKLEGHFMRGTAALSPSLNDDTPTAMLANQWWLLAAKTTVYF